MTESYYNQLAGGDILSLLADHPGLSIRDSDGRIHLGSALGWDTAWHHVNPAEDFPDCYLLHKVMFDMVGGFVPSRCQQCFKTVVRPKTLKQLFALLELEKRLDLPSKCGIETRPYTPALYGGYFYGRGLEQGLEYYKVVRRAINEDPALGPEIKIILKRGCTEMELACGPSDKWAVNAVQEQTESLFKRWVVHDQVFRQQQPEVVLRRVHLKWIEFAYEHGDETYLEFTGGEPLHPSPVTYHHLAEQEA